MSVFKSQLPFEQLDNGLARRQGLMSDGSTAWEVKFAAGTFDQLQKRPTPSKSASFLGSSSSPSAATCIL